MPQSLFAFQRVRIACALAKNGKEWQDYVGRYNSGTYNKSVVDQTALVFCHFNAATHRTLPFGLC